MGTFIRRHPVVSCSLLAGAAFLVGAELLATAIVSGIAAGVVSKEIVAPRV
jgi:hypothetical protein